MKKDRFVFLAGIEISNTAMMVEIQAVMVEIQAVMGS